MTELSLIELYENHAGKQSDKWSGYLPIYERLFFPCRWQKIRLLEIGVQNGGSLEIWGRFFPNAQHVIGCDIDPLCRTLVYDDPRIKVVVGDATGQRVQETIFRISNTFDIIIDDGSHTSSDIIRSFCRYFHSLAPGGLFIIEDLHCSYWLEFEGGLFDPSSAIAFFKALVDVVHRDHWGLKDDAFHALMKPFALRHGDIDIDPEEIATLEFHDSMCVVRKRDTDYAGLGKRIIRGDTTEVSRGLKVLDGSRLKALEQGLNPFSLPTSVKVLDRDGDTVRALALMAQREHARHSKELGALGRRLQAVTRKRDQLRLAVACHREVTRERDQCREEVAELTQRLRAIEQDQARLNADVAGYRESMEAIKASLTWRITAPFRALVGGAVRMGWGGEYAASIFRLGGGPVKTWVLLAEVLRKEGWGGVKWRLANARRLISKGPADGGGCGSNDYAEWIRRYDTLDDAARAQIGMRIAEFCCQPLISVLMPVFDPPINLLEEAIRSVRNQIYPHWELCIADDASPNEAVRDLLQQHAREDSRIKLVLRSENGHISAASNSALELAEGEFVALMDHDDLLPEHALFWVVDAIQKKADVALIYSDEDKLTVAGVRYDPYFKCELNRELLLAQNMISHLGVYRRAVLTQLGGFREGFEGSQDYDLALRVLEVISPQQVVHIPRILYHWRAISGSTALSGSEKNYAAGSGRRAVIEHLRRIGVDAQVVPAPQAPAMNRIRYALGGRAPMVSILIPTRDRADLLAKCIDSIQTRSSWKNYEIFIVDNGSVEADTFELFERVRSERIRILRDDSPFNFSSLNNRAAAEVGGEMICLMNNDIEVRTPYWMEEMLGFALQPDIGCVGARLWYPNGTLQHAGVLLGVGGVANHAHLNLAKGPTGYFGRAVLQQEFSAVTGACLMIRKEVYEQVGGLDEQLAVAFNDIDFCLRVRERGYRNVWTPYAEFVHHESLSRGAEDSAEKQARFESEVRFMQTRWGGQLMTDPAYSPNLTLDRADFSLAWPPRVA